MKFFLAFLLGACYVTLAHPHPMNVIDHPASMKLTDTATDQTEPPTSKVLMCLKEEHRTGLESCEVETETKLKGNSSVIELAVGAWQEKKFIKLYAKTLCECILLKTKVMDEATSQLDMTKAEQIFIEESSLTPVQRTAVSTSVRSCILGNLNSPSSPIFIERLNIKPGAAKPSENNGNLMTSVRATMCIAIGLIQNSCADPSLSNDTLTRMIKEYETMKDAFENLSSSSEETD